MPHGGMSCHLFYDVVPSFIKKPTPERRQPRGRQWGALWAAQASRGGGWPVIEHCTGQVCASVCGGRKAPGFLARTAVLQPWGITRFSPEGWGASRRHRALDQHTVGKPQTQQIARQHPTVRARMKRLARKTLCCSPSIQRPDLVIGLCIHRFAYGRAVCIIDQLI